jgi:hypothetical protein
MLTRMIAACAIVVGTAAIASGASLAPSRPSDLIVLESIDPVSAACVNFGRKFDRKLNSDGTVTAFTGIPAGMVLVLTGVDWIATGTAASQNVNGFVTVQTPGTSNFSFYPSTSDGTGKVGTSSHSGGNIMVVRPGPDLCFSIDSALSTQSARLYGYLARDR